MLPLGGLGLADAFGLLPRNGVVLEPKAALGWALSIGAATWQEQKP